jgi:Pyruvate/2-oxoacid:ferredoxin oxidoreductase delta subunit/flavodoxin
MSMDIYYFSGTGNSLAVARDIAERAGGKLIPMASVVEKDRIVTDADAIGIVFPVYYVGLCHIPLIVRRFVDRLDNVGTKYVFAVCTYGGGAGKTLKMLDDMVRARGGRLAAGFGVQMPQNAFDKPFENRERLYRKWKKKVSAIAECVNARQSRAYRDGPVVRQVVGVLEWMANTSLFRPFFTGPIYRMAGCEDNQALPFAGVMPLLDRTYHADEKCAGCGTCAKVCPVRNIEMVDGKPSWLHRCENCLACVNWCPKKAIHGYGELPGGRRYHHPEVKLSDLIRRD